ncbi:aldose 1-epimerase [Rhodotorula toruloides]|uniref:BY PROTMAP: gi/472580313/gb/EMS18126.1/ aldose 1-epimerase [Rhodosporidium toruloides NP11] gi/647403715/emb/CDR49796.1/ RHTO0S33e00430g1_1 [Rhodosporidium toruloides] n=1 Tax=Rhodotorula toruloides TaxID=5286 RepID=A0A0K3CBU8_RHOTO|nr:aldose 1-epimerase [Rhodotorula toruloides]
MLQRVLHRLQTTRVSLPTTEPSPSSSLLTPNIRTDERRRTNAPLSTLLSAILLPGALLALSLLTLVYLLPSAQDTLEPGKGKGDWKHRNGSNVDVFERFWISTKEPGTGREAKAAFIALGATMTDFLLTPSPSASPIDLVLGYENTTSYLTAEQNAYFGAVVGRYANRIANASFTDPSTGETFHLPPDERGKTTLHGGTSGYSRAGWKVRERTGDRVVFSLRDEGAEGFPGTVITTVTYTLLHSPIRLRTQFFSRVLPSNSSSSSAARTPIMLSSHTYWNLDGFQRDLGGKGGKGGAEEHEVWVQAEKRVEVDDDLVPTGRLISIPPESACDFYSSSASSSSPPAQATTLGERLKMDEMRGLCGPGCTGLDTAFVLSRPEREVETDVVMRMQSRASGIRMDIRTNQPLIHLFSSSTFSPTSSHGFPRKPSHLPAGELTEEERYYPRYGALAIEQEGWIDAVHHAEEWGVDPFYSPERPYSWWSEYEFSQLD